MGSPPSETVNVSDSLDGGVFVGELVDLKKQAMENRHDLKALKTETEKAEAEVLLARADRLPNVTAGITFSRQSTALPVRGGEDRDTDYLIGLKLSVPIPFFDRNQAGIKESQAGKSSAEIRKVFVLQSIEREVEAAHARLSSAQKAVALYRTGIIPQLEENLKLVQEAYQLGEMGILAVIDEQKKFIEVNDSYLTALYNLNTAVAKLEAAVGVELKKKDGGNK